MSVSQSLCNQILSTVCRPVFDLTAGPPISFITIGRKIILSFVCIFTLYTSSAQSRYGTYSLDGTKYYVSDNSYAEIRSYCPAVANALSRGRNVEYYSYNNTVYGTEARDWSKLLTPDEFEKINERQKLFGNAAIKEARQQISSLRNFDPRKYQITIDLTRPRYLSYGVVGGKTSLLSTEDNRIIKTRLRGYLNWNYFRDAGTGNPPDVILVYNTFRNKQDAEEYTNSVRNILESANFWDRLDSGALTTQDISILEKYGVFVNKNIQVQLPTNRIKEQYKSSSSGFVLSSEGIIVTNYHAIEDANGIDVLMSRNGEVKTYKAKVLISDKTNDISLLKIDDTTFTKLATLPYAVNTKVLDVGTKVFALGYPMSDILGEEIKLTDGLISSRTGYQGDIVTYQISAPIQPGSSGGPLFDQDGNIVGITNAGVPDAQNVGYAIKSSYLRNLIDVTPENISLPMQNSISGLSFTEKIKRLSPYVVLIKVY